jgi:xylulokinase
MAGSTLIGIDIGSSSTKVTVFDRDACVLGEAREPYAPRQDAPGVAEYDPDTILDLLLRATRSAVEQSGVEPGSVAAIGIASMVAGIMAVDHQNLPTSPYTTTLDVRFAPFMDRFAGAHGPRIRALNGSGIPALAAKIAWLSSAFPAIDACTARFVTINAHLMGRLTGATADDLVIDHTFLWCTGLADTQRYAWSDELCTALGIDRSRLPRIVMAGRHAAGLSAAAAERTGLLAGTPVVLGSGDQCAGLLAAGVTGPGLLGDVAGTYPTLAACVETFEPDPEGAIEVFPSVLPGRWHPLFFIGGGGLTHAWATGTVLESDDAESLAALGRQAAAVEPGSAGVVFVPHLGGRACPSDSTMRGAWLGLTWTHDRGHLYRALLESIAYEERLALDAIERLSPGIDWREVILYGGAGANALLNQIKADALGVPVRRMRTDTVPLGAALLGAQGVGLVDDLEAEAARLQAGAESERFDPDPGRHAQYRSHVRRYEHALRGLSPVFRDLAG